MIPRAARRAGRNVLLALIVLLVTVGAFTPGLALAQGDAGPSPAANVTTETEPNEYYATANPIELDQRVRGTIRPYDTDTFAVNVTQPGARITVDAAKEAVGIYTNLSVTISSPEDEYLGSVQLSGSETNGTALATALDAGTYYVSVRVNHATFPYELEVSTSNVDGVPQEQNRENATPLTPGENATGTLTVDTEAWYAVNATAGDELTANLTTDREYPGDFSLQIYGPDGAFITDAEYLQASTVARTNGTHYVYLTRNSREPLDYTLATAVRDTRDPTEPNEDRANATPVETGTNVTGELAAGDQDWYAFEATAGRAILPRLELRGPNRERSIRFGIYGPNGEFISAYPNDGMGGDPYSAGVDTIGESGPAEGAAFAEANGTYYVRVSAGYEADNGTGPYALSVATRRLDRFDPNQRAETATHLTPNVTVNATVTAYDPDWYAFEAAAGDRINVSVDSPFMSEMDVLVYGPDGTVLRSSGLFDPPLNLTINAVEDGTYRVALRQSDIHTWLLEEVPYDLSVDAAAGAATPDADADRLSDAEEAEYGTDPNCADTDGDGLADYEEVTQHRTDPTDADTDDDGRTDYEEKVYASDPTAIDSDGDGWSDRSEASRGYDPYEPWSHP